MFRERFKDFALGDAVFGRLGRFFRRFGDSFAARKLGGRLNFFGAIVGDGDGGFFAGRAAVNFNPILVKPEFDFVVTILIF